MRQLVALSIAFVASNTLASQPGQPLDCSDWVFLEPGLSCHLWVPVCTSPTVFGDSPQCIFSNDHRALTNDSRTLRIVRHQLDEDCGNHDLYRLTLEEFVGNAQRALAYLDDRCIDTSIAWLDQASPFHAMEDEGGYSVRIRFDPVRGSLLFTLTLTEECTVSTSGCAERYRQISAFEIRGFAPLLDVLQSYVPSPDQLGYAVPAHPEGLRAADYFDTYWGTVTQPLDLANAQPLQCAYPAAPPNSGDYLTIDAPVPTPTPGAANYVLTAVTYQGQTRAGRKSSGGRLTGRDASRLPACLED